MTADVHMLIRWFVAVSLLFSMLLVSAKEVDAPKSHGVLEHWSYDVQTQQLHLQGWSLGGRDGGSHPRLVLEIGGHAYESDMHAPNWTKRVDIPSDHPATGGQQGVGFDWRLSLRDLLRPGVYPVRLAVLFDNGQRAVIKGVQTESPAVVVKGNERRLWVALILVLLGILVIVLGRRRRAWDFRWLHWLAGHRLPWVVGGCFALLVALGVTGSSMGVLFKSTYGASVLDVQGASRAILGNESVRGDEWGVQLPNVLAQWHHEPRFPVVNDLLGEGGQNMGGRAGASVGRVGTSCDLGVFCLTASASHGVALATAVLGLPGSVVVHAQRVAARATRVELRSVACVLCRAVCGRMVELATLCHHVPGICLRDDDLLVARGTNLAKHSVRRVPRVAVGMLVPGVVSDLDHHCR